MGIALWSFLLRSDGTFRRYPQTRLGRFLSGDGVLGHEVGSAAYFIDVAVTVENRRAVQASHFWYPRYRLSPEGRISKLHWEQIRIDAVQGARLDVGLPRGHVLSIGPHLARRRNEAEHRWHPDPEQLAAAVAAINEVAGVELVTHDRSRLLWIDYGMGRR